MKDQLFLLAAPFEDAKLGPGAVWFCPHCALIEGAMLANPHWADVVDVRRVAFPRPRAEVVALVGEAEQSLPLLILADDRAAPATAYHVNGRLIVRDAATIAATLAARHGGSAPHP